mgnify:FL=1
MSCRHHKLRHMGSRQRGAALIVALLVFAIAAALMVGLQRDFTLHMERGRNGFLQEQAWVYLQGAENLATMALRLDAQQDTETDRTRDDLSEQWAQEATPYPLDEQGWLMGELEDLQGRFNVNNLVNPTKQPESDSVTEVKQTLGAGEIRLSSDQQQFIRLLQSLEGVDIDLSLAQTLTAAVIDFIDADDSPQANGAEAEGYRNLVPAYRPANQPLASVSELRAVKGVTPEIYNALAPFVSVWPPGGSLLNIHTAPTVVLRSLNVDDRLDPLSANEAGRLDELRAAGELVDIDALLSEPVFSGGTIEGLRGRLGESSSWFLLTAQVELAGREQHLVSVLERDGQIIRSRYRSLGEL